VNKMSNINEAKIHLDIMKNIAEDVIKDSNIPMIKSATVASYDVTSGYAIVTFPSDSAQVSLRNLSGQLLSTGDIVEVILKNNSLTNSYIIGDRNNTSTSILNGEGTIGVSSINGRAGTVTLSKSDVGLQNVDNTSDLNKPVSNATQALINTKFDLTQPYQINNFSTAPQTLSATTRTYLTGSKIHLTRPLQIGTILKWTFDVTKTATGTASSVIDIAFGTTGTTTDTARISFTKPAGTAVVDNGLFTITAIIRNITLSGSAVGHLTMTHNLTSTGLATISNVNVTTVSSTFDMTIPTYVGVCFTSGTADSYTIQMVMAETVNL
jgi:hypothetical protein